jgi:hypothetical protein
MKEQKSRRIFSAIFDKRLYGLSSFVFTSVPFLAIGLTLQVLIYLALNRLMLIVYLPLFAMLILMSALGSKNFGREVNNMGYTRGFLFFIAAVLASLTPFILKAPANPIQASFQFILLSGVSVLALIMAVVEITVCGQRVSLRNNMQLTEDFFKKQKQVWKQLLVDFPNSESIIKSIDEFQAIPVLFDKGSFSLAVLWSCNVIEQTTDAIAEGIISKNPTKMELFRKEDNSPIRYPKQLRNLGFNPNLENNKEDERVTTEVLWHEIRRKVAHYNYRPTFEETFGATFILTSFIKEMPNLLQNFEM